MNLPPSLAARFTNRPAGPAALAVKSLRSRRVAVVCFFILIFYFALMGVTYITWPDREQTNPDGTTTVIPVDLIGERFERLATRRLVDDLGVPLDYQAPSWSGPIRTNPDGSTEPVAAYWDAIGPFEREAAANLHFIFGTDVQGRSVFWRTLYGTRMSLTIAFGAALLAIIIGTLLGAIAGYFGGWLDLFIVWLFTTVASVPRILLVLAMAYSLRGREFTIFGLLEEPVALSGTLMLVLAMGLTTWVGICRLIRGEILKQRSMDYESAARALGFGRIRILIRHLLPNVFYLVIIQFSLIFPLFIHLEVILSYLGLGPTDGVSWGQMIEASLSEMMRSPKVWWQLTAATIAVFGISLALNLFGDALRDALDPRLQNLNK